MYAIEYFHVFEEFVSLCEDFIYFLFYKNTSRATVHVTISFLKPFVLTSNSYLVLHVLRIPYCACSDEWKVTHPGSRQWRYSALNLNIGGLWHWSLLTNGMTVGFGKFQMTAQNVLWSNTEDFLVISRRKEAN